MRKKILIKVSNGLGNQLFIYWFGILVQEKMKSQAEVLFDYSDQPLKQGERTYYSINDLFVGNYKTARNKDVRRICGRFLYINRIQQGNEKNVIVRLIRKLNSIMIKPSNLIIVKEDNQLESTDKYLKLLDAIKDDDNNYLFDGYWEDIRYLPKDVDIVRNAFTFKPIKLDGELNRIISQKNIVSIHIRRTDYVKESESTIVPRYFYNICDDNYYDTAIEIMRSKIENPLFIVFSDDITYAREKFGEKKEFYFISGYKDYEELYIMTLCQNSIIANSTFSFWGAYLRRKQGIVVAPKTHYIWITEKGNERKPFFSIEGWEYI
ncbi:alpha-1,2-fucosyltransferase [Butyrivibrio sp. NC2002]|uniref:alpha-1,2-fucosyltransferase n=1 Tax=Butyrivibrio sp. NC2002 TaxID=1410610 RepID=UPI000689FEAB|nr:alpha-1,2-fucosyltransferase [Butyrivibrio sp. NC2002]